MKAYEWVKDWNIPLNELASGSSPPAPCSLFDDGPELQQLHSVKDLGILLESWLTPSAHCIAAVKKARAALFLVKRSFVNLTPAVFIPFFSTLVRPHSKYAIQAISSYLKKDIYHTERVQRLATWMVKGLHHLPYIQRLLCLNLCFFWKTKTAGWSYSRLWNFPRQIRSSAGFILHATVLLLSSWSLPEVASSLF